MVYNLRFFSPSKCSLFHNSNVFGSCIIHILYTGYAIIKENNNSGHKRLNGVQVIVSSTIKVNPIFNLAALRWNNRII